MSKVDYVRLAHDVGKYLVRAARNLDAAPIPAPVADMLVRDLYEAPGGGRPAARFAALAHAIDEASAAKIAAAFLELDALEPGVRARREAAMRQGAAVAIAISDMISRAEPRS